ncbi:hypothetical protein C499_17979 [Halogeometricum borinquense DSM 11551]|uniref:Uncharacterized protein n=1 Tax=Halogeometricum borinquense (strain ATCC 700274 / DSM 11551 / JCM 10706 / KCTC 4070 / PR3) TaxID=469382 RepID=E4NPI4_HALBP|nr:hypothetical protein [Halogeometricum borinquense]ADQ67654.1 hypothetical protein Hbor_20890 [Halogeometricum borinquense DSM 11551]ELY23665.1 hypothetical protein C499_17979 [Halogeometricum borinquense DSM 11551]
MPTRSSVSSNEARIVLVALCFGILSYSVFVETAILLGVMFCGGVFGLYLAYQLVGAFVRLVDSVERIADALEGSDGADRLRTAVRDSRSRTDDSRDDGSRPDKSRSRVDDRW